MCSKQVMQKQRNNKNIFQEKKSLQHYMSIVEDGGAICTLKTRFEKKMKRNEKMGKPKKGCRAHLMIFKK
jgi:hypothetical protein